MRYSSGSAFRLDVGVGDPLIMPIDLLETPALFEFAGIPPTAVPCYPIVQQIAEKVHAYTQIHPSSQGTRVKDLVDILLMAELGEIDAPASLPFPPRSWEISFRNLASEVGLGFDTLDSAGGALQIFLNPALSGRATGTWSPHRWSWMEKIHRSD
ncbi:MAG: nucleotidyl transferase AbiEii/AbiGii toxin family protein [Anaerolineales bacterium]|nr:nucleotidyl transferase AbiEii/AbiGii toxin family protein [Anaerolineales bacterium]